MINHSVPKKIDDDRSTYLQDILTILNQSLALYHKGYGIFYRVMAVQLRMLLCDSTRRHNTIVSLSLVPRVYPALRLHFILEDGTFDLETANLSLDDWLKQPIGNGNPLTIRELIRRVCDQDGGAHIDPKCQAGLPEPDIAVDRIVKLSEYITRVLACQPDSVGCDDSRGIKTLPR